MFDSATLFDLKSLAIASAIGFLIGFEREWTERRDSGPIAFAGVRTFTLVAFMGALAGLITEDMGLISVIFASIAALTIIAYWSEARSESPLGVTTEVALITTLLLGLSTTIGHLSVAVAGGVFVVLLLSIKRYTEKLASSFSEKEIHATLRFLVISVIILPLAPDQGYGPYGAINPRDIWLMVVFISGLSFVGYWLMKIYGQIDGVLLTSLIGGLASSNATTLSVSKIARDRLTPRRIAAAGIIAASAMMMLRVSILVAVVAYGVFQFIWPILLTAIFAASAAALLLTRHQNTKIDLLNQSALQNPLEVKPALLFAGFLGLITLAAAFGADRYGEESLYLISLFTGGLDVDAATIAASNHAAVAKISAETAARAVLIAVIANLCAKVVITGVIAGIRTAVPVALALTFVLSLAGSAYYLLA